ncbi:MAG TPA: hypothetical protein VGA71_08290, partial [Actinomycetota bacterium]
MTQTTLAAVIVGGTLVAWALFMLYLRARPEAAPQVESSLMSPQASTGAVPGTVIERSPRARRSGDDAAGVTRRQFINRAYFAAIAVGLLNFALASL